MILLLSALALAEPYRATATLTAGAAGDVPALHGAFDYGVVPHVALLAEGGSRFDGEHAVGAGLLFLPVDGRWARAGLAVVPELADPLGDARPRGRAGLRAGWLALWGLGLAGRCDLVLGPGAAPQLEWGLGLSVRM